MLIIQSGNQITEIGYNFMGKPYIKGAEIKDYQDMYDLAVKLKQLKTPMKLPDVKELRIATGNYEHLSDIIAYSHKYITVILNLNTGCQYAVPNNFRNKNKSEEVHYGDIPCYAYEWNDFTKGETPFHIVSPPEVLHSDTYISTVNIVSETEHWDSSQVIIKEGGKYVHLFKSKKEHTLIKYKTTFSEPYLITRETRNNISRWHSVLANPLVDTASIDTLLYN